jgi:cellulose synthase/poly-beta-1,6-N-acetylglucosamine synthase-like glycosyltransferase
MNHPAIILFCACAAAVAYAYVGYPLVVWLASRLFGRDRARPAVAPDGSDLPPATLLIAAYNEESVIAARIENALAMDYPPGKLEIVVASDGSADATPAIVARYADRGVRLLDYKARRGKASVLNAAMEEVRTPLVLLSDANTDFAPDAARKLAPWFADPAVGTVCGRLVLTDPETGRNADGLYWRYETFLKKCEARLGALLGSNGAIYAIRRSDYRPIPPETIVDDLVIPLLAKVHSRHEIVYDAEAVAVEETAPDVAGEFRRRARIGAGGFQAICLLWPLLDPRRGWIAFSFLCHKVLRWLCPFFLIGMLLSTLPVLDRPFGRYALGGQVAFYLLAAVVGRLPTRARYLRPLRLVHMFTSMNLALLFGFWRWVRGTQKGTWTRTARLTEASPPDSVPDSKATS